MLSRNLVRPILRTIGRTKNRRPAAGWRLAGGPLRSAHLLGVRADQRRLHPGCSGSAGGGALAVSRGYRDLIAKKYDRPENHPSLRSNLRNHQRHGTRRIVWRSRRLPRRGCRQQRRWAGRRHLLSLFASARLHPLPRAVTSPSARALPSAATRSMPRVRVHVLSITRSASYPPNSTARWRALRRGYLGQYSPCRRLDAEAPDSSTLLPPP